ncbi:hypothetical protein OsI_15678 [Oryza sativa Indica Group]|uniref:RecQ-mediated genome instability protein 1 n=1 Tax=Oryza sativa subsp. indica TaxID=39946 RepID=B8AT87_ORYSI|nr:hypothetical protein OsI_15678 [Oryza sativa Indica Group]
MRRRNLIITSDSDSDDGGGGGGAATASTPASASASASFPSVSGGGCGDGWPSPQNPRSVPVQFPSPSSPPPSPPIEISDEEEAEAEVVVEEEEVVVVEDEEEEYEEVDEFLRGLGLQLRPEWLESCAAGVPGFYGLGGVEAMARRCFEQFLFADMNACGAGVLPEGVGSMHNAVLDGPFVLQVDEIVNLSAPLRERYRDAHAGPKRCLKLSMTDGIQRIYGMEYRPIKDLEVLAPAGFKIVIRNVHIRRGLFMLVPEVIEILGGVDDELDEARNRLVSEVNKPPRGKRKQGGLPLSSRATLAAWPTNANATNDAEQGASVPRTVNTPHPTRLGNASHASQVGRTTQPMVDNLIPHVVVSNAQEQSRHIQEITMQGQPTSLNRHNKEASASTYRYNAQCSISGTTRAMADEHVLVSNAQEQSPHIQEITMQDQSTSLNGRNKEASASTSYRYNAQCSISGTTRAMADERVDPSFVGNNVHEQMQRVQGITMQDHISASSESKRELSVTTPSGYDSRLAPHGVGNTGTRSGEATRSSNVDDGINNIGHPISLCGENEKPFTYIFNMLADWGVQQDTVPYIQGKIKGLITSVKRFQYKQSMQYDLYVYIDDGSFITEAFVDRDIVQNMIGLSAEELAAALSSGGPAQANIRKTMKAFEHFLVNFEGTILIELNRDSSVPIVREMNKGCSSSDAWQLLRRVKTFSGQGYMRSLDFMDTTP